MAGRSCRYGLVGRAAAVVLAASLLLAPWYASAAEEGVVLPAGSRAMIAEGLAVESLLSAYDELIADGIAKQIVVKVPASVSFESRQIGFSYDEQGYPLWSRYSSAHIPNQVWIERTYDWTVKERSEAHAQVTERCFTSEDGMISENTEGYLSFRADDAGRIVQLSFSEVAIIGDWVLQYAPTITFSYREDGSLEKADATYALAQGVLRNRIVFDEGGLPTSIVTEEAENWAADEILSAPSDNYKVIATQSIEYEFDGQGIPVSYAEEHDRYGYTLLVDLAMGENGAYLPTEHLLEDGTVFDLSVGQAELDLAEVRGPGLYARCPIVPVGPGDLWFQDIPFWRFITLF